MNAAIYARYSSDLQRPTSVQDQVREQRSAAERLGYTILDKHIFTDEEISGSNSHRRGYQRLLAAARAREFDCILVEAQDRLWRSQAEMYHALDRLRFWGVRVIVGNTGADLTDRTGRLVASVMGWKDEAFLDDLRDKTRRGMMGQITRGFGAGGRAYGYRSEAVHDDSGRIVGYRRVIDPQEAEAVRYIYRLYADGLTPRAIAHRLNSERVPPPRTARGRRAGSWTPATIHGSPRRGIGILCNTIYAGKVTWGREQKVRDPDTGRRLMRVRPQSEWTVVDAPELRVVPEDLWERVQARRARRVWTPDVSTHGSKPRYLLSGLLICSSCNGRYVVQKRRANVRYYACAVHFDRGPAVCSNGKLIRQDRVEKEILAYVFGDLFAPHRLAYLQSAVNAALERALSDSTDTAGQREAALRQARQELDNIAAAIRAGIVTPTTKTMLEDAERRVATLEQAIRDARQRSAPTVSVRSVIERYLRDLRATLETNIDEARRMLSLALDKIVLRTEGEHVVARITGKMGGLLTLGGLDVVASVGAGRGI